MRGVKLLLLVLTVLLCLWGCRPDEQAGQESQTTVSSTDSSATKESTEATVTQESTEATAAQETTLPAELHSSFYLEGFTAEQVVTSFSEVVLDAEYSNGEGNIHVVQKWTAPIRYMIHGQTTQKDREKLEELFVQLNAVEGFPGIEVAPSPIAANLTLNFYNRADFQTYFGRIVNYEDADGAVEYWYYNQTNQIYNATVGYRTDIDQYTRNSVLLEEVINGLGITDTKLREDSITYQGFSQTQALSEMDWLILRLLYHPDIKCGMNLEQCKAVIEKLYY
jgi:uncharacterized protein YcfL